MIHIREILSERECPTLGSSRWFKVWAKRAWNFPSLLSYWLRNVLLSFSGMRIGSNSLVGKALFFGKRRLLSIGNESFVGRVTFHLHTRIEIGNCVVINDGVTIFTASHDVNSSNFAQVIKPVEIGDYAWIASGATILPGVHVGRGAVVGAGAVVSKNVPEYAIVVGNPARELTKRRSSNLDYSPVRGVAFFEAWYGPSKTTLPER